VISYLHCYVNDRSNVDWNTCGQAAIATISDYWGRNPYGVPRVERDSYSGRYYWDDGQAIDAIKNGGYGPDVVFGWGTTGGRLRDALRSYGLNASVGHSGFFSWGWDGLWRSLQDYIYWNRPVPVMVDLGRLGGPAWGVHWAIAYRTDGSRIYLGNMSWSWNARPTYNDFLSAWHCWFLPYGFNHCAVYC
jgi:hypothetical protein